ncbi:hypothetical protein IB254_08675 [Pseudomonas sp. PDM03]|uniref:hypothetical protein n=1 Tax=Pseudomonas TaxID=286 RepID=UPI001782957D|nr:MULTISPECIES: hypothetical protein [Pseudomonas]MBD9587130.1 hypothetical protein [Pseudomonas sp. PDM03]MCP1519997.1 hypothetical protein [Pseudomonas migulae]
MRSQVYRQQAGSYKVMIVPPTGYSVIVTKSVKGVYQNPTYMNATPTPKIHLANKANPD